MLLATMAMVAAAAGAAPPADAAAICPNGRLDMTRSPVRPEPAEEAQFRKLVELPPANLQLAVLRTEDGCIVPVIVRYGIGGRPKTDR